jgi:hypothetical protein
MRHIAPVSRRFAGPSWRTTGDAPYAAAVARRLGAS